MTEPNQILPVLIIGGGISGITAAVELAETGRQVILIEKEPYLGGNVARFNNYFPKMCPPSCGLEINYRRIRSNPRIQYYTGAEITGIHGCRDRFRVNVSLAARMINNRCTSCGKCVEVCPVPGAIQIPGGLSFPMKYTIDASLCEKEACARCGKVCAYDAIQLDAAPAEVEMEAGRIIVATGWSLKDVSSLDSYRYSEHPDVVTNLEFEMLLARCSREQDELVRPSDGRRPGRIAFVQCAGSRDRHHLPYCSAVCCSASLKQALTLVRDHQGMDATIFYIDLRVPGRNETLLREAGIIPEIHLVKGKVGRIAGKSKEGKVELEVEDIMAGRKRVELFDMVVLAVGLVPNEAVPGLPKGTFGFYEEEQEQGIIPVACAKRPMDVVSSVRDATAAALKAIQE